MRKSHDGWNIQRTDSHVSLRFDLCDEDDKAVCRLCLDYDRADTLVVRVAVHAPSDAVVVERIVLRNDLRTSFLVPVATGSLRIEPTPTPGVTTIRIWESGVALTVLIPASPVVRFLAETDQLVDPIEGENAALGEQLELLLHDADRTRADHKSREQ